MSASSRLGDASKDKRNVILNPSPFNPVGPPSRLMGVDSVRLTILMPCLNEAETLASCIEKARIGLARANVLGEIVIADNGSIDGSIEIAERLAARLVRDTSSHMPLD